MTLFGLVLSAFFSCGAAAQETEISSAPAISSAPLVSLGFNGPDVQFPAADGWQIAAAYRSPAKDQPVAVLLHAYARDRNDWRLLADELEKQGYGYLALDFRGHGQSAVDSAGNQAGYRSFRRTGTDNEFNQMTRDVEAAAVWLSANGVAENRIALVGAGLGANVAVKFAALHPEVPMMALLTPTLNANRDVLTVNPMRGYGRRPVMIIVSPQDARIFAEADLLRRTANYSAGPGNVTFVTEFKNHSYKLLNKPVAAKIIQWLKTPSRPPEFSAPVSTEAVAFSTASDSVTQ